MENQERYIIKGQRLSGILAERLDETRIKAIASLPGVVVYTSRGVFYSELYIGDNETSVPNDKLTETTQGLVELTTNEAANFGRQSFTLDKTL